MEIRNKSLLEEHVEELEVRVSKLERKERIRRRIRIAVAIFIIIYIAVFLAYIPKVIDTFTSI